MCLGCNNAAQQLSEPKAVNYATAAPQRPYYGDECVGQAPYQPPTLREEAQKSVGYHREQADKADRAIAFLRENPAFDEFVRLVRAGVIQF